MALSSLSVYVVFVDHHQGNKDVMPFLFLPLRLYVEFIGREKARAYLQYIYCNVKQRIQRELSHTIKSRCACVWIYMVSNLILLCSSKTYLSFWNLETFAREQGLSYSSLFFFFFQAGIWVPIVLNISDTFVSIFSHHHFFLLSLFLWITFI